MRTFCIGDIHGENAALQCLRSRLENTGDDPPRLWLVGDLVNRGPDSAAVLRQVRAMGNQAVTILGNHDLSLLVLAQQPEARSAANDSLRALLSAPDRDELLDWLRQRPLLHRDTALGWTMVHAGIPAEWTVDEAVTRAGELERALRGPDHPYVLRHLLGNTPERWHPDLDGIERLRYITNALTRQRFVHADGRLDMAYKKTLAGAPKGLVPWFAAPGRASAGERIVFGHWSALETVAWPEHNVWCLDTGAAWGGPLTAMRLDRAPPTFLQVGGCAHDPRPPAANDR